ncbi:hypothetical protein LCGC14_1570300 [marine sediment metagenome]|uniref:Uncharacterized protein n=1 Tax=marine sediment metagenome TaxID=412755 RepID=A0A0F9LKB4_9ZZZZ
MNTPLKDNEELVLKLAGEGWTAYRIGKEFGVHKYAAAVFLASRGDVRYQEALNGQKKRAKTYKQSEKGKIADKKYSQSVAGKAVHKQAHEKYSLSEKGVVANSAKRKRYNHTVKGVLAHHRDHLLYQLRHPERCAEQAHQANEKFKLEHGESYSTFHKRTGGVAHHAAMKISMSKNETVIWNGSRKTIKKAIESNP